MFINTRAAIATILKDLKKIVFSCFLVVQLLYIAFLSTSLFLGSGILVVNIILLIASIVYFVLRIVSYKIDFKNEKAIMKFGNTSFRRIKIGTQIFTVFSMLYGFFIASEEQNSWSLVVMLATFLLCFVQILIECAIQFIENRKELLIDALKHDFEGFIKTADFFNKVRGNKDSIWGDADKNNTVLKEMATEFKKNEKQKKRAKAEERKQNRRERRAEAKERIISKLTRKVEN